MPARIIVCLLLITSTVAVAAGNFRPANFDVAEAKQRMDRLVLFPEVKGNVSVMLTCFSQVQSSGKMEKTGCFTKDQYDQPYAMAVNKAAKKARMNPALIGGKAKRIYLQFRVEFIAEGDEKNIYFHMNPGYQENIDAYGYQHIAGQRVFHDKEIWLEACPKRARFAVWARAYLSEDGKAENPSIVHADGVMPTSTCQDAIRQTIVASEYTPTIADGEAVPSTFVELFGN